MTSKKDTLLRIIDDSQKVAAGIEKSAGQMVRNARFVQDVSECAKAVLNEVPNDEQLDSQEWNHLTAGLLSSAAETTGSNLFRL